VEIFKEYQQWKINRITLIKALLTLSSASTFPLST